MRHWGTVTLMIFAFIVGFASTYSCGGGGSSASAAGDADTLQGYSASDFAFSTHSHSGYATTAMLAGHTHDASDLTTGRVANGRLSGTYDINITGNAATAADAGLLDSLDSSDFATSLHVHRLVLLREGYAPGSTPKLSQGGQLYWSGPMPPEFLDGGIITVEAIFFEDSPIAAGDVVLTLGIDGINDGDTITMTPSLTPMANTEQLFTMNGDPTLTVFKAAWVWAIADSDFLQIGLLRGSRGALTDTFGSEIAVLGFQVTYTN